MKKIFILAILCIPFSCGKQLSVDMKVLSYNGKVTVNAIAVTGINMKLKNGDIVETMGNSSCDIIINDKNILRLKPDSRLAVKLFDTENILQLDKGWLGGVTRKVFTREGKFTIKTPTVTAAIRGTSFCIKVENEKSTYFCTCNGSIELQGEKSNKFEKVEAAHHSARRFSMNKSGVLVEDSNPGILYHADNEVEELAKIINEKIDWSMPDKH